MILRSTMEGNMREILPSMLRIQVPTSGSLIGGHVLSSMTGSPQASSSEMLNLAVNKAHKPPQVNHSRIVLFFIATFILLLLTDLASCYVPPPGTVRQQFGKTYAPDIRSKPFYQFDNQYFRGYFGLEWDLETFYLEGLYIFYDDPCPPLDPSDTSIPSIVREKGLASVLCLRWSLKWIYLPDPYFEKHDLRVTFTFLPAYSVNVDPLSVRAYNYSHTNGNQSQQYDEIFSASESPQGPWTFSLNLDDYWDEKEFLLKVFAYDKSNFEMNETIVLNYPRVVIFGDDDKTISINYETIQKQNGTNPYQTICVSKHSRNVSSVIEGYVVMDSYLFNEENYQVGSQYRSIRFLKDNLWNGNSEIDLYSLKCVYTMQDGEKIVDETSSTFLELGNGGYRLICPKHLSSPIQLLTIIGKPINIVNCKVRECEVSPGNVTKMSSESLDFYMSYHPSAQINGTIRFIALKPSMYPYPIQKTVQQPLKKAFTYLIDISRLTVPHPHYIPSRNFVKVRVVQKTTNQNQDPFSLRAFLLKTQQNGEKIFDLISRDDPFAMETTFALDLGGALYKNDYSFVFMLCYFDDINQNLGDVVTLKYPRDAIYDISEQSSFTTTTMNVSFQNPKITYLRNDAPFYKIQSTQKQHQILFPNHNILKCLQFESGNNLLIFDFQQTRTFNFAFDVSFRDLHGVVVPVVFEDLRCAYLIPSNEKFNETLFIGSGLPIRDEYARSYSLKCAEQIYSEHYVLMIVAKKFQLTPSIQQFGQSYDLKPKSVAVYKVEEFQKDILSLSCNPNSRAKGEYRILNLSEELDRYTYDDYYVPHTKLFPLSILEVYEVDLSKVIVETNDKVDTMMSLLYQRNTLQFNLDPLSYRFFIIDDSDKRMQWFMGIDSPTPGPWFRKFDISEPSFRKFKFAVFGYKGDYGVRGTFYSIHYSRSINYGAKNGQYLQFTFTSTDFPTLGGKDKFALYTQAPRPNMLQLNIVTIQHITLSKFFSSSIQTKREFFFDDALVDSFGNSITNYESLRCAFAFDGNIEIHPGILTMNGSRYIFECSVRVHSEEYDWLVITQPKTQVYLISMLVVVIVLVLILVICLFSMVMVCLRYWFLKRRFEKENASTQLFSLQSTNESLDNSLNSDKHYNSLD